MIVKRKPKDVYQFIVGEIIYNPKIGQFILKIGFDTFMELEWGYYLYEYPILALKRFSPSDILKFHKVTGLPGFKGMSIKDIENLKEKIKQGQSSQEEVIEAIFKNDTIPIVGNIIEVYSNQPDDTPNFLDEWFSFLSKITSVDIPIELHQNELIISSTSTPLTNIKKVSNYIFTIYKERLKIDDTIPADLTLDKMSTEDVGRTLEMLAFKEATLKVSDLIAKLISDSLPISEVIKTFIPTAFSKLLEAFKEKKIREILEENIRKVSL